VEIVQEICLGAIELAGDISDCFSDWPEEKVGQNTSLVFTLEDAFATCEQLKAKGVEFIEESNEQPWGVQAQIKDQDGNVIVMVGR
jgi:uncharacterized glyoxalase superfamily protein PhnB